MTDNVIISIKGTQVSAEGGPDEMELVTAGRLELCELASGPDRIYVYPNGDQVYAVGAVYLCREDSGELRAQPEEVARLEWFDVDALPELSPPEAQLIARLAGRIARELDANAPA